MSDHGGVSEPVLSISKGRTSKAELVAAGTTAALITDVASRERAARLVKEGACVASFVRAVCVIWIDAANRQAVETIYRIKGERRIGRPMATTLGAERFVELLDPGKIAPAMRKFFLDPQELEARLGMLCLIRAPVKKSAAEGLPSDLVSQTPDGTHWLQSCVVTGVSPTAALIEAMLHKGVEFPGVTSMNLSGHPEIVDQNEAQAFCRERRIPLILADPEDQQVVRGSFPIIEAGQAGVKLVRAGHFPGYLFRYLLDGAQVELAGAAPAKFPLVSTHSEATAARIGAKHLRAEILARLEGRDQLASISAAETPGRQQ